MYYANEESDDIIGGFTKTVQHSIKNISRTIKQCSLNLEPEMYITKKTNKMTPDGPLPWQQLWRWLCWLCCKWGQLLSHRKRLEPRVLSWQQHSRCHFVSLWCTFLVPSLKSTAPIFLEIFLIQYLIVLIGKIYDVITFLICIIQKL